MSKTISFLLAIGISSVAFSQQLDTASLYKQIALADSFRGKQKLDSADMLYHQAIVAMEKEIDRIQDSVLWMKYASCYMGLCFNQIFRNKDMDAEKNDSFKKAVEIAIKRFGLYSNNHITQYRRLAGIYEKKDSKKLLETDIQILDLLKKANAPSIRMVNQYINIGLDYNESSKTLDYLKMAESLYIAEEDTNKSVYIKLCLNQAAMYERLSEPEKAAFKLGEGIKVFESIQKPSEKILGDASKLYHMLGLYYWREKYYNRALDTANRALNIKLNQLKGIKANDPVEINRVNSGVTYQLIARIHTSKKEFNIAEQVFYKAIEANNKAGNSNSIVYNELSNTFRLKGDFVRAMSFSDTALRPFLKNENFTPPLSIIPYSVASGKDLIEILTVRSDVFKWRFEKTQSTDDLGKAKYFINEALVVADNITNQANLQASRENLQQQLLPIYEHALRLTKDKYEAIKTNTVLHETFTLLEKSKAMTLREAVNTTQAELFNNVPKPLLEDEKRMDKALTEIEKNIYAQDKKENKKDTAEYKKLQQQQFDLKGEKENWTISMKKDYPEYYQLRLNRQTISIDSLRHLLQPNQSLIEYFVGDSSIYILFVNKFNIQLKTVKKDFPLNVWVDTLRNSIKNPNGSLDFTKSSYALYQKLILPIKQFLPPKDTTKKPHQLIIIPDGILGYLPFEALISQATDNPTRYATHKYLINDYIISYNFSATLFEEMRKKQHRLPPTKSFVGFAPFFKGDTTVFATTNDIVSRGGEQNWPSLSNSGEEMYHLRSITEGVSFIDKAATSNRFMEIAHTGRMVHLATHGKADDRNGSFSFLVFASNRENILYDSVYVKDIYNQPLNADMVVLSACETGIGKLQRGEGIVSLSRSFAYAGAKSVFYTLWVVDDAKTKDLMIDFYKNLKKGMSKDEALWQAKIAYLYKATNNINKQEDKHTNCNPYFWASIIGIGDMSKMKF